MAELAERVADFLKSSLSVPGVVAVLFAFGVIWLVSGWRLRGWRLGGWLLVPLLVAIASFCVAGQDRLFPDGSLEGAHLIRLGEGDAITLSDLIGLAVAGIACLLAIFLVRMRRQTDNLTG